jgi:hypothetical protein
MKRQFPGLQSESPNSNGLEGLFLVQVEHACYFGHPQKPFFALRFKVVEPKEHLGRLISGRLYCHPKALWKLNRFLREFDYDSDLLGRNEVDERSLLGLMGVIKTSRVALHGRSFLNVEAFAPASEWEEPSAAKSNPVSPARDQR